MMANNEIGVIQPLKAISEICCSRDIGLHSDYAQCLGFLEFDSLDSVANMLTISSVSYTHLTLPTIYSV